MFGINLFLKNVLTTCIMHYFSSFFGRLPHTCHVGAFTHRDTLRRFSHWSLCSHPLALSLSQLLGHCPRRGRTTYVGTWY